VLKRSRAMMSRKRRMAGTAVYGTVRTVVGEDGGREPSSYPIGFLFTDLDTFRKLLSVWIFLSRS
jgi:hypothetical protein